MPDLVGSKYFIITKTKDPRCIIEPIFVTKDKLRWAERAVKDTLKLAEEVEAKAELARQFSHCKTLQRECDYYPLCPHYSALADEPERGASGDYLKRF